MQLKPNVTLFTGMPGSGKTYQLKEIAKKKSPDMPVFVYGRSSEWSDIKSIQLHSLPGAEYNSGYAEWNSEIPKMKIPGQKVLIVDGVSCATMIQICALTDESFDIYFSLQDMTDEKLDSFIEKEVDRLFIGKIAGVDKMALASLVKNDQLVTEICEYTNNGKVFAEVDSDVIRYGCVTVDRRRKPLPNFIRGKRVLALIHASLAICMTIITVPYFAAVISYLKKCTSGTLPDSDTIVSAIVVLVVYFGYIIVTGKNISALFQRGKPYEIIYHRNEGVIAVGVCEFFYYGYPVHCIWKTERKNKESAQSTDKVTLLDVKGENITKKNRKAVKLYISEWAEHAI